MRNHAPFSPKSAAGRPITNWIILGGSANGIAPKSARLFKGIGMGMMRQVANNNFLRLVRLAVGFFKHNALYFDEREVPHETRSLPHSFFGASTAT